MSMTRDHASDRAIQARKLTHQDYARAERFLPGRPASLIPGAQIQPKWLSDGVTCWYRNTTGNGKEFILVDTRNGHRGQLFDHTRLAAALTRATGTPAEPANLPFDDLEPNDDLTEIQFDVAGQRWKCDLATYDLTAVPEDERGDEGGSTSPDGRRTVFVRDHDLYLRDNDSGQETRLTSDGSDVRSYGSPLESTLIEAGIEEPNRWSKSTALWSPDSRLALSYRIDSRDAESFHWLQTTPLDGSLRPKLYTRLYPLPGEETLPTAQLILFNAETGDRFDLDVDAISVLYYGGPLREDRFRWSSDNQRLYVLHQSRGYQTYTLWEVDCSTGDSRKLISEHDEYAATDLHPSLMGSPQIRILDGLGSILWFSQRDGWGHIYQYDLSTGTCQRQITSGDWSVLEIHHVDEQQELIYFSAIGKEPGTDPYYPFLYRCQMDGSELTRLTDENAFHDLQFAPSGEAIVDVYSRVDLPTVAVLRSLDGSVRCELERADVTYLETLGWKSPERFSVKARDGVTDVYGVLYLPTWFDAENPVTLPVLDDIYGGPQTNRAPATFAGFTSQNPRQSSGFWHAQAIAELGFAVVMVDGLGMPFRSRKFHSHSFRNLIDGGIEEHVLAIRYLADKYPFLDSERVGIYGHSAGGYSSMNAMLRFPDFYKVAVSSAGNHDHRLDKASWIERYMGLPVCEHYREQANASRVENLKGKLLLIHGEMDENVHVASTMQLVDALIQANKKFDMLILPNRPHACVDDPYFIRRRWDYFVEHLLGAEPPEDYEIGQLQP